MGEIDRYDAVLIPGDPLHYAGVVNGFTGSGLVHVTWFALDPISGDIVPHSAKDDIHYPGELEQRETFIHAQENDDG